MENAPVVGQRLTETTPVTELTISHPVRNANISTFTFKHRRCYTIPNYDAPIIKLNCPLGNDTAGVPRTSIASWARYPTKVLPTRSLMWWINQAELGTIMNAGNAIRFKHAKLNVHDMSFRTQFITGSNAVGYANSNMQMRGLICDGDSNLPPYGIWSVDSRLAGGQRPGTQVDGIYVDQHEWGTTSVENTPDGTAATINTGAVTQFAVLPYEPYFMQALKLSDGSLIWNQGWMNWPSMCELVGKKVKEWGREYDLEKHWHGKWISMMPHAYPDDIRGLGTTDCTQGGFIPPNPKAGIWQNTSDLYIHMTVCPTRPGEFVEPYQNQDSVGGIAMSSDKVIGTNYIPNKDLRPIGNLFLGVEHLQNADGTIVPIIWDFYIDTEITIEVRYDEWPFTGYYFSTIQGDPAVYPINYNIPSKKYAHWNRRSDTIYHTFGISQAENEVDRSAGGGPNKWGDLQYGFGFGSMGMLGSMMPSQNMTAIYPDLRTCSSSEDGQEMCTLPGRQRFGTKRAAGTEDEDMESNSSKTSTSTASKFGRKVFGSKR